MYRIQASCVSFLYFADVATNFDTFCRYQKSNFTTTNNLDPNSYFRLNISHNRTLSNKTNKLQQRAWSIVYDDHTYVLLQKTA